MRYHTEVVLAGYLGAVAFAPGLPAPVLFVVAALGVAAVADAVRREGPFTLANVVMAWGPVHLVILAAGGAGALATPLAGGWAALTGRALPRRLALVAGAGAGALLVGADAWSGGLEPTGALEGILVMALGLGGGALAREALARDEAKDRLLERILEDAADPSTRTGTAVAARRIDELAGALEQLRASLDAERAVVWDVDGSSDRARPRAVAGPGSPPEVSLAGSALRWVWEETMPLRMDVQPSWALPDTRVGAVSVVPRGGRYGLLTLEWDPAAVDVDLDALREASHYLGAFVRMLEKEEAAERNRARYDDMVAFVRALPGEVDPNAFPGALARTAAAITGATGALVARNEGEDESGRVVGVAGSDGGPAPGSFTDAQSICAWAARNGSTFRADHRLGRGQRPVARPDERWNEEPRAVVAIPLMDDAARARGVLAIWNTRRAELDPDAVALLEVFAPIFALQLQHGSDLSDLRERAERDALTGLANRSVFDAELREATRYFDRYRRPVALVVFDIDHFKAINDTHGHAAGDTALRMIGRVVDDAVREVDVAARYGGEEFALLLRETTRAAAADVAERLRATLENTPVHWGGETITVRASFGVSACPECVEKPAELMASADAALYRSKREGRNRVTAAAFRSHESPGGASSPSRDGAETTGDGGEERTGGDG